MKNKTVREIMVEKEQNATIDLEDTLRNALVEMNNKKLGVVNVVDSQGKLKGIITDGDIRRLLVRTQDTLPEFFNRRCKEVMITNPHTIEPSESLQNALNKLEELNVWVIPVAEDDKCVGTIHLHKLLKAMMSNEKR